MATTLTGKSCKPCKEDTPPVHGQELLDLYRQVPDWEIVEERMIRRTFKFPDYARTLDFVQRVGELAELEDHHPEVSFGWGRAKIELSTHKIKGLSENDFILAAKIDQLLVNEEDLEE